MFTVLQINSVVNTGSTGRIAEGIGDLLIRDGCNSYIAFGRYGNLSTSKLIKIGSRFSSLGSLLLTRLRDLHGFGSKLATKRFIRKINELKPDIIHLHNIHGYYLNIEILFEYLSTAGIPVIWTLHDCWAYTGHCAYYTFVNCSKWKTHCFECPQIHSYPKSFYDGTYSNYERKRNLFLSIDKLTVVPVSKWLERDLKMSYLHNLKYRQIYNGIDLSVFKKMDAQLVIEKYTLRDKFVILGVANAWDSRKGLNDFLKLNEILLPDEQIVLVGLTKEQINLLPGNIIGIPKTESVYELASLYNAADVYVNTTWEDNFPTTNLEALACGTPVVTYNTGGSIEAIDEATGVIVQPGDISQLKDTISLIKSRGKIYYSENCIDRANSLFDKKNRFGDYIELYKEVIENNK